jgi:hypothetical protein
VVQAAEQQLDARQTEEPQDSTEVEAVHSMATERRWVTQVVREFGRNEGERLGY